MGSIDVSDSSPNRIFLRLRRGSTDIGTANDSALSSTANHKSIFITASASGQFNTSINYLDTPNTTSATTYNVAICSNQSDGNSTVYVNRNANSVSDSADSHSTSQLTLMEILA